MDGAVMALENEQVLVARAALEPAAFAAIYEHYFPLIYNYLRYRLRDARAAEDATSQDQERSAVETARANGLPAPSEAHATFVRAPDGFSLELLATNVTWEETLAFVERLDVIPGADPARNARLMRGCASCQ